MVLQLPIYHHLFFFFKQKTAYEIYQCDWSSDVCSSDLIGASYFENKDYNKAFTELRKVMSRFPGTDFSNKAFYRIGEGHFQLKDYKRDRKSVV